MPGHLNGQRPNSDQRSSFDLRPIYLLADSSVLFQRRADGFPFLTEVVRNTGVRRPSVAYIGASNGDNPSFYYEIFLPAFEPACIGERRMVVSRASPEDKQFLEHAEIILLAGGSVEAGWHIFEENGFGPLIHRRYLGGAMLLGVSAGAVQIGRGGLTDDESSLVPTFGLLPLYVGVHEESENWKSLRRVLTFQEPPVQGIGIPAGGGVMYHSGEIFPIKEPVLEIQIGLTGDQEAQIYPNCDLDANGPKSENREHVWSKYWIT